MDTAVDVLVTVQDVKAFRGLLTSLDVQTLPADAYRVVAVADGLDQASRDLLTQLAAHRPNVVVTEGTAPEGAPPTATLPVREGERLTPSALELLLSTARDTGAGVVVGKAVTTTTDWTVFDADRVVSGAELASVDVSDLAVLVVSGGGVPPADVASARRAAVDAADRVAVLASRVVLTADPVEAPADVEERRAVDVAWRDGVLEMRVAEGGVVRAVLSSLGSGEQWSVPAADETGTLVRFDLATMSLGDTPSHGPWRIDLHLDARGDHVVAPSSQHLPCALVELAPGDPWLVIVASRRQRLQLDIGAGRRLPRRLFRVEQARISESARGTLLEWPLMIEDFTAGGRLEAGIRLWSLPFAAELVHTGGEPVLRAWLSGLPGSEPLLVRIGTSGWNRTGTTLEIANGGTMKLVATPAAEDAEPEDSADEASGEHASGLRSTARRFRQSYKS